MTIVKRVTHRAQDILFEVVEETPQGNGATKRNILWQKAGRYNSADKDILLAEQEKMAALWKKDA